MRLPCSTSALCSQELRPRFSNSTARRVSEAGVTSAPVSDSRSRGALRSACPGRPGHWEGRRGRQRSSQRTTRKRRLHQVWGSGSRGRRVIFVERLAERGISTKIDEDRLSDRDFGMRVRESMPMELPRRSRPGSATAADRADNWTTPGVAPRGHLRRWGPDSPKSVAPIDMSIHSGSLGRVERRARSRAELPYGRGAV